MGLSKIIFGVVMSLAGSAMVVHACINKLVLEEFRRSFILSLINNIQSYLFQELAIVIEEKDKYNLNNVYQAAMAYLSFKVSSSINKIKLKKHFDNKSLVVSLGAREDMIDVFEGIKFRWCLHHPSK
ncbi:putative AAA-type ATPase domain-containing protein [Dioscorea sansibarensis]